MHEVERLASLMRSARRILVFTGAGISTGSGIPDFRGPQGVWKKRQPVYYQEFLASEEKRVEYWDYKSEGWESFVAARPNAAHEALVRLERLGKLGALVTQNIDGLHQLAGTSTGKLLELHGTNRSVECVACKRRSEPAPSVETFRKNRSTPLCPCGGWLKFATISFGQALDSELLDRAATEARKADMALSLGSTLSVYPAAGIPAIVAEGGHPYAVVNRGETEHDAIATLRLEGDVSDLVPRAIDLLASAPEAPTP